MQNENKSLEAFPVPYSKRQKATIVKIETTHIGPIPSPDAIREYEEVVPGSAERIIAMAERQGDHRRRQEQVVLDAQTKNMENMRKERRLGQIFAFLVVMAVLSVVCYAIKEGLTTVACVLGGGTLISLVTVFIKGRSKLEKEPPK